ncbi:MAG: imidazoleglycerol-phosphate dehydratase HisB [Planctomycetota bacterium]|jgi:imidazoleglycerol-phosphate dehydratase|nr:imidazoleglycerol-phosphate dehydratase HisB [Planctomycetota bacterium]
MERRAAELQRETTETGIRLALDLDGSGKTRIATGVAFFDHMLTLFARHALFDLELEARGDTGVDAHHTVEDVGICLGKALALALGDKAGIARYGHILLPMDEALVQVAADLSGRPHLEWRAAIPAAKCGDFDTCLGKEFARALTVNAGLNLHVTLLAGEDPHHSLEAIFKGLGRALRQAAAPDAREKGIPSSKGVL